MKTQREKFLQFVDQAGDDECWLWTGSTNPKGYGKFSINVRRFSAHRLAWVFANGPIPDGMYVLHNCDNPTCVNPHHLFLGTHQENMLDMVKKGRSMVGDTHPRNKLTGRDLDAIRKLKGQYTQGVVAEMFGVSRAHVSRIQRGYQWRTKHEYARHLKK